MTLAIDTSKIAYRVLAQEGSIGIVTDKAGQNHAFKCHV